MLFTALIAGVAICAMMAANGFKGRPNTVGIDLGTTYSVIAIKTDSGVNVLRDNKGRALIPSAVYFAENGEVIVGNDARKYQHHDPKHFIYNAKRFIGRLFNDDQVTNQAQLHPFDIVSNETASHSQAWFNSPNQRILTPAKIIPKKPLMIKIINYIYEFISKALTSKTRKYANGGSAAVGFGSAVPEQDFSKDYTSVSPESIGAHILNYLLDIAEENLGHRQVSKAVMAVPAKFNSAQRIATYEAFKQAGLSVNRIIEEPTAAALAYGLDKKPNVDYILVYDIGGGTLDVSLLFVNKESVQVIATHGDDQLGGADFDHCLAGFIQNKFNEHLHKHTDHNNENHGDWIIGLKKRGTLVGKDNDNGNDDDDMIISLPYSESNIMVTAEKMKQSLSDAFEITLIFHPKYEEAHEEEQIKNKIAWKNKKKTEIVVTRDEFESLCSDLFDRVLQPVNDLLNEALMQHTEVDEVVLVGGSSRIPHIREKLKDYFNIEHLNDEIDADLAVALGAASIVD